jgi:hypothetical protein
MQITHEEARRLIQFDADQALKTDKKTILRAHLKDCMECREYAADLKNVTLVLTASMHKKWDQPYSPLPRAVLLPKRNSRISDRLILATRIAAVGAMAIAFLVGVRQVTGPAGWDPGTVSASALPIPTPSIQSTSTKIQLQSCGLVLYVVQKDDTIERIADQFSVTPEQIIATNGVDNNTLQVGMELSIESCAAQPTGTFHATGTLYTPLTSPTTSTPGG